MTAVETLTLLFESGVQAVRGDTSVARALTEASAPSPDQIIAVGKAATAMAIAAHERFPAAPLFIATKYGHAQGAPALAEVIEAAHPVLDENSLHAGTRCLEIVAAMPAQSSLLILVSGGASALVEAPVDNLDLAEMKQRADEMLASGADIHAMNKIRKTLSRIKGGKLLQAFKGAHVSTLAISDVEGDALSVIGSGIGDTPSDVTFDFAPQIVASNAIARDAVSNRAHGFGLSVQTNQETLYDDINAVAPLIGDRLKSGPTGLHLWGGEPTVVLPKSPGRGGRNQALALLIAREIAGQDGLSVLVAGTDGTDGPTDAAGALVTGATWDSTGQDALDHADAGTWLDAKGALLRTGPTGTNVMDLVIALKD